MTWTLAWTDTAFRDVSRLDPPIAKRIVAKLESILEDPVRAMKRLKGADDWRLRVGDHRVLCLLSFETETVIVERVGHRSNVYQE